MTHTPGPWFYSRNGNPIYITGNWDKVAGTYADVAEIAQQEQSEAQANARLIAEAPDMLALLKKIYRLKDTPYWESELYEAIEEAKHIIVKVEEQSP